MSKDHSNFIGDMMDYESGTLSDLQTLELFAHLIKTGLVWNLQGSYGRSANALIGGDLITPEGVITDHAYDLLGAQPEVDTNPAPDVDPHNDWGVTPEAFAEALS